METFGKFVLSMLIGGLAILSRAFAVVLLWRWYVVPLFHLPPLTWRIAYGLALLLYVMNPPESVEHEDKSWSDSMIRMVVAGGIVVWTCVAIGWLLK
jgi:hypothetical protein